MNTWTNFRNYLRKEVRCTIGERTYVVVKLEDRRWAWGYHRNAKDGTLHPDFPTVWCDDGCATMKGAKDNAERYARWEGRNKSETGAENA
jgi:hypothetical protein